MNLDHFHRLIAACFPHLEVHSIAFLAEGWDSTVWEVNGTHVFRFPKRPEIVPGLLKEIRLLPVLAPALPLPVPHFEYVWLGGLEYEGFFVGYRKVPGMPLTPQHLTQPARVAHLARQLGEFLTALHCFPLHLAVAASIPAGGVAQWRERYHDLYRTVRDRVFPLLSMQEQQTIVAGWEGFLQDEANFRFSVALVHADLSGEHILFDIREGYITGIIDWEDAAIGDPALDFTGLLADYGFDFASQVLAAYAGPADDGLLGRARFYRALAPFYEVLFGLDAALPQHVTAGLDGVCRAWHSSNDCHL